MALINTTLLKYLNEMICQLCDTWNLDWRWKGKHDNRFEKPNSENRSGRFQLGTNKTPNGEVLNDSYKTSSCATIITQNIKTLKTIFHYFYFFDYFLIILNFKFILL